jgi:hypothetical protein
VLSCLFVFCWCSLLASLIVVLSFLLSFLLSLFLCFVGALLVSQVLADFKSSSSFSSPSLKFSLVLSCGLLASLIWFVGALLSFCLLLVLFAC